MPLCDAALERLPTGEGSSLPVKRAARGVRSGSTRKLISTTRPSLAAGPSSHLISFGTCSHRPLRIAQASPGNPGVGVGVGVRAGKDKRAVPGANPVVILRDRRPGPRFVDWAVGNFFLEGGPYVPMYDDDARWPTLRS